MIPYDSKKEKQPLILERFSNWFVGLSESNPYHQSNIQQIQLTNPSLTRVHVH